MSHFRRRPAACHACIHRKGAGFNEEMARFANVNNFGRRGLPPFCRRNSDGNNQTRSPSGKLPRFDQRLAGLILMLSLQVNNEREMVLRQ
jgi:hypothetical protein